jgi:hypothetical protein
MAKYSTLVDKILYEIGLLLHAITAKIYSHSIRMAVVVMSVLKLEAPESRKKTA